MTTRPLCDLLVLFLVVGRHKADYGAVGHFDMLPVQVLVDFPDGLGSIADWHAVVHQDELVHVQRTALTHFLDSDLTITTCVHLQIELLEQALNRERVERAVVDEEDLAKVAL